MRGTCVHTNVSSAWTVCVELAHNTRIHSPHTFFWWTKFLYMPASWTKEQPICDIVNSYNRLLPFKWCRNQRIKYTPLNLLEYNWARDVARKMAVLLLSNKKRKKYESIAYAALGKSTQMEQMTQRERWCTIVRHPHPSPSSCCLAKNSPDPFRACVVRSMTEHLSITLPSCAETTQENICKRQDMQWFREAFLLRMFVIRP